MMLYRLGRLFFKFLSLLFFPISIKGRDNIPADGSFILASNHLSNLDPFIIGTFCGHMISFVAKEELFKNKILGSVIAALNAFPIKRNSADFRALRETLRRVKKGGVLIFPEGTRKFVAGKKNIYPGVGFVAVKSQVPVIPVYIEDTDKVLPPGGRMLKRHHITLTFGDPITFPSNASYDLAAQEIIQQISALKSASTPS